MSIVTTPKGESLVSFHPGAELTISEGRFPVPLTFSVVIAKHKGKALFVFNSWRQEWELPAGGVKPGETPDVTAQRELAEETNQMVSSLHYAGLCLLRLPPVQQYELGAAYRGEVATIQPFTISKEASAIMFWDLNSEVEGFVNAIARWLAQHI